MSISARRRDLVGQLYGFEFPPDLLRFWEFACRLRPLEPLAALDALNIRLVGPFEVLDGRFDGRATRYPQLLHWRYYADPPEFFTVLAGTLDGLHWGYYFDDPADGRACVASYFVRDDYEISTDGDTLFEALRLYLEQSCHDCELDDATDPHHAGSCSTDLETIERIRGVLMQFATGDRPERGIAYEEKYPPQAARDSQIVAATLEGMGIVAPGDTYRPFRCPDPVLWRRLERAEYVRPAVRLARRALRDGYPATALRIGKDLWAIGGRRRMRHAFHLLEAAYTALRRPLLREVLRLVQAHPDLPSVDIVENEDTVG